MKPPYEITSSILQLVASISEKIGQVDAAHLAKQPTELRKKNRIKTIQSSLEIEGNTLTAEQITALLNNKRIIAPEKDIIEVKNAVSVYDQLRNYKPESVPDFKLAHKRMMTGLLTDAGKFRKTDVGIVKGSQVAHLAPPGQMVNGLVKGLFAYTKSSNDLTMIKSCVFHYELEFIHPFIDGNGRMGRLWQTVILLKEYPVFEFLPIETIIKERQEAYYRALNQSDKSGQSTIFIDFMLSVIDFSLELLLNTQRMNLSGRDRILLYKDSIIVQEFTRKDYMRNFKEISAATASRDLRGAVEEGILAKSGDKRKTTYRFK
ncbi:MAG: Fic family protein [Cyclobacteriaceae bacterium]